MTAQMSSQRFVLTKFPKAKIVWLNKNRCYVDGCAEDKLSHGVVLSGQFRLECDAWDDAARRIKEWSDDTEAGV